MIHDAWIAFIIYISAPYSFIEEPLVKYRQHSFQQLGLITENPMDMLRGNDIYSFLIKIHRTECERIEGILEELAKRPALEENSYKLNQRQ